MSSSRECRSLPDSIGDATLSLRSPANFVHRRHLGCGWCTGDRVPGEVVADEGSERSAPRKMGGGTCGCSGVWTLCASCLLLLLLFCFWERSEVRDSQTPTPLAWSNTSILKSIQIRSDSGMAACSHDRIPRSLSCQGFPEVPGLTCPFRIIIPY